MKLCEKLKEAYTKELSALIDEYKANSIHLKKEDAGDEASLETIKANIADIFCKMFLVSYNKSCQNEMNQQESLTELYNTYLSFFDKIPASWKEHMEKDKELDMMKEYYIEQIKLETAGKIKDMFLLQYDRCRKEV